MQARTKVNNQTVKMCKMKIRSPSFKSSTNPFQQLFFSVPLRLNIAFVSKYIYRYIYSLAQ